MKPTVRRAALTVSVIATLAAGRALTDALPTDSSQKGPAEPFVVEAKMGEQADLRYAKIKVLDVRPALGIEGVSNLDTTPGHFVVVDLEVVVKEKPLVLSGIDLLTPDQRRYAHDYRWLSGEIPTGVTWYVTSVFEVPADAMAGATLAVAAGSDWWAQRRDHVLHVDLGIDDDQAKEFAASRDILKRPDNGLVRISTTPLGTVPDE